MGHLQTRDKKLFVAGLLRLMEIILRGPNQSSSTQMDERIEQLRAAARATVENEARNAQLPDAVFAIISYNTFSLRFGPHPQPLPVDLDVLIDRFSEDEIRDASRSAGALLQAADQAGDDLMSKRSTYEEIPIGYGSAIRASLTNATKRPSGKAASTPADVRFGSKCEELNLSKSSPPRHTKRTSWSDAATSPKGQNWTSTGHAKVMGLLGGHSPMHFFALR
jgi:hypothetical protein